MAIEGKVRTLFTDKTQQEALFPKTKIKAISDDNGIGLDSILDDMVVAGAAVNDATVPVNADTLGGRPANDYVTDEEVVYYSGDIAIDETVPLNADTLQGYKASDFATTDWVKGEIANAQLGGGSGEGEIDLSGFALKTDVSAEIDNKISNIDYPVDSVNGKAGNVTLSASDIGATSMTLLWENASLDSIFAAQRIPLDWRDYDFVLVEDGAIDGHSFTLIEAGGAAAQQNSGDINPGYYGYTYVATRSFFTVAEGIDVTDCYIKFANSNAPAMRNDMIKPSKIYGIKGVQK